jgi:hypothetical protein
MAKCAICKARKGKRRCPASSTLICSSCCGASRSPDTCGGCSHNRAPVSGRNYSRSPHFPLPRMEEDLNLQDNADIIESAICRFDEDQNRNIDDTVALRIVELLLDKYFFGDEVLTFKNALEEYGFTFLDGIIQNEMTANLSNEEISRILGTIYRSIKRRSKNKRENRAYIEFVHKYVGVRIDKGLRLIRRLGD